MAWRAAAAQLLLGQLSLVPLRLSGAVTQPSWTFQLQQPQDLVSVAAGGTITLTCTTSGDGPPGPVKWLKGWGSEKQTVYEQTGSFPRVTRLSIGSNSDFNIQIGDAQPEDAGTYYCVKFQRLPGHGDQVFKSGKGTVVSLQDTALGPSVVPAAVVLCILLLLGLFFALCMYQRKRRGGADSQCLPGPAARGSSLPIPLRCCPGTPDSPSGEDLDAETSHLPSKQSSKEDNNIHYADLQPLPTAPWHGRSPRAACSEYASVRVAAK